MYQSAQSNTGGYTAPYGIIHKTYKERCRVCTNKPKRVADCTACEGKGWTEVTEQTVTYPSYWQTWTVTMGTKTIMPRYPLPYVVNSCASDAQVLCPQ
jgi:DnaJ-class molecular chaperone